MLATRGSIEFGYRVDDSYSGILAEASDGQSISVV